MTRPRSKSPEHQVPRQPTRSWPALRLEFLEDRAVPAYTATLSGTTATFTGDAAGDPVC
jgi:hypothetical protein